MTTKTAPFLFCLHRDINVKQHLLLPPSLSILCSWEPRAMVSAPTRNVRLYSFYKARKAKEDYAFSGTVAVYQIWVKQQNARVRHNVLWKAHLEVPKMHKELNLS